MSFPFSIKEHTVDCQHIREYARATSETQEDILKLAVKQYIPLDNPNPQPGDITIIGAHANGFPKELYEPLWEDLHALSKVHGFRIRSIWIADIASQGVSSALNEHLIGNDPSWLDHSRDLLHMINMFRADMPRPLVGIGHSFGGAQLVNLSLMHPRLLSSLVLLDPVLQGWIKPKPGSDIAQLSAFRRDLWPSKSAATKAFRKQKFYQAWDTRVLDRWCEFGVRPAPTLLYPSEPEGAVTLSTQKHQECFTYSRPTWEGVDPVDFTIIDRELLPDLDPSNKTQYPFYRPESHNLVTKITHLRPSVLYVFGSTSDVAGPKVRKEKLDLTGVAHDGSGGVAAGRVAEVLLEGIGHLVAMEATRACAEAAASWFGKEAKRFEQERKRYEEWTKKSWAEKSTMSDEYKRRLGGPPTRTKL